MKNNNLVTIVFVTYHSHKHVYRLCKSLGAKFNIIIIENSLDKNLKSKIENKYKNTKVIIPNKNLGIAAGYNIGIKKSKTKYIYLNCPDMDITNNSINQLIRCAEKLKNFGLIAPNYKNTSKFNNYVGSKKEINKKNKLHHFYKLSEVSLIDNSFFLKTSKAKKYLFDENFFLYFEVTDFCQRIKRNKEKIYISNKIKFDHFGSDSVSTKYSLISQLTKSWHYNWGKFYFYKKHHNYIYALNKIIPNIISSLKKLIVSLLFFRFKESYVYLIELFGIFSSIFFLKSFYRPKK